MFPIIAYLLIKIINRIQKMNINKKLPLNQILLIKIINQLLFHLLKYMIRIAAKDTLH